MALCMLCHTEGANFFKIGEFQGHSKQLNLEQDPDYNTR